MSLPDADQILVFTDDTGSIKVGKDFGAVLPALTTTERDAIVSPKDGALIYNITEDLVQAYYNGFWNSPGNVLETVSTTPFNVTDEKVLLVDTDTIGENTVINLPTSASRGNSKLTVKNLGSFIVSIIPDGSEEIEGNSEAILFKSVSLTLAPSATDWSVV